MFVTISSVLYPKCVKELSVDTVDVHARLQEDIQSFVSKRRNNLLIGLLESVSFLHVNVLDD